MDGICSLRGSLLTIIDGRERLGMPRCQVDGSTRVLVLDVGGSATGFVVDKVSEVLRISEADMEEVPDRVQGMDVNLLTGIVELNAGKRMIMVLGASSIVAVEESEDAARARGAKILQGEVKEAENNDIQLVTFLLDEEEYAFDIMHVKEIIRSQQVTAVPYVANYMEGVITIRNQLMPIINMRLLFGLENSQSNEQTRIIIVDLGEISAGFRVDKVSEVVAVSLRAIEPPPLVFSAEEVGQIRGVAKLNEGKRLLMCLNATQLLSKHVVQSFLGQESGKEIVVMLNTLVV